MTDKELDGLDQWAKSAESGVSYEDVKRYRAYVGLLQSGNEYEIKWEDSGRDAPTRKPNPRVSGYSYVPSIMC